MQPDASQEDMMALVRLIASASGIENTEAGYQGMKEGSRLTMPEGYDAPAPFKGPGFKVKAKKKRRDPPPPKKRGGPAGTPEALRKRRGSRRQPELDLA